MFNKLRSSETLIYRAATAFVVLFWLAHVVLLPVVITYDSFGYIDMAEVLGSSRFPRDWIGIRVPLFPLSLKFAFWIFGRHAITAILVPAGYTLAGILLLGASVKRVAGKFAAAGAMVLISLSPTLISYQHSVLTETGTFFFLSLTLYLLLWTPKRFWVRTVALTLALGIGYYWRQNLLALAPVAALFHGYSRWREVAASLRDFWQRRSMAAARPALLIAAQVLLVAVVPFETAKPWDRYNEAPAAIRNVTLLQGMLRQALIPPEHPWVGPYKAEYYAAIRSAIYHGNFLSGLGPPMAPLAAHIWARPTPKPVPQFFLELAIQYPGRYLNGIGRTLAFFAGFDGQVSDNRNLRGLVLSPTMLGSKISDGPEPLHSKMQRDFTQRTTPLRPIKLLRSLIPLYDPLQIAASMVTVLGLAVALWLMDFRLLAFCAIPSVYALGYAVFLVSLDRFAVPVYPLALANLLVVPLAVYRRFSTPVKTESIVVPGAAAAAVSTNAAPAPLRVAAAATRPLVRRVRVPAGWQFWIPVLVLLALPIHMIVELFGLRNRIPRGDEINMFATSELYNGLTWSALVGFANEHRIAFTRIFVYLDYVLFHGLNLIPGALTLVLGLLPPALCLLSFQRLAPKSLQRKQALLAGALLTAIYFNGNQTVTLVANVMLHYYLANAFLLAAAWSLTLLWFGDARQARLGGAMLFAAALCGSFSSANGILIAPATVLAAGLIAVARSRTEIWKRWKTFVFLGVSSVVIALGYIIPYFSQGGQVGRATRHVSLLDRAHFVLLFLGAPFWRTAYPLEHHSPLWLITLASLAFLALVGWVGLQLFRRRASLGKFEAFHLTVLCFILLTALVGSFFRIDSGVSEAFNKRYAVTSMLFWLSTLSLLIAYRPVTLFGNEGQRLWRPMLISVLVVAVLTPLHLSEIHDWLWVGDRVTETASSVGAGIFDLVRMKTLYYDDAEGFQLMDIFRSRRAYFLADYPLPPYPLQSRYTVRQQSSVELQGTPRFVDQYPGRSGYLINGTMPTGAIPGGAKLLIVDAADNVVGYGNVSKVAREWGLFVKPTAWFAAFRNPNGSPFIGIYVARGSDAYPVHQMPVPAKASEPLAAPSSCQIAGVRDIFVDVMNEVAWPITGTRVEVTRPSPVHITGWAVDRTARSAALGVQGFFDGKPFDIAYGLPRPEIAKYLGVPAYGNIGFEIDLPTASLSPGDHALMFRAATHQGPGCRLSGVYLFTLK